MAGGGGGPHVGCQLKFRYFVGCQEVTPRSSIECQLGSFVFPNTIAWYLELFLFIPFCANHLSAPARSVLMVSSTLFVGRQGSRVVGVLDFESVGPGFESHSEHFMDLFHGSPEL